MTVFPTVWVAIFNRIAKKIITFQDFLVNCYERQAFLLDPHVWCYAHFSFSSVCLVSCLFCNDWLKAMSVIIVHLSAWMFMWTDYDYGDCVWLFLSYIYVFMWKCYGFICTINYAYEPVDLLRETLWIQKLHFRSFFTFMISLESTTVKHF